MFRRLNDNRIKEIIVCNYKAKSKNKYNWGISVYNENDNEKDIKKILNEVKSIHPKAKHFPYAYILGTTAGKTDDKEPHNSAGMQIYNILNYNNLNSHLLIIIRYFGGTKLGAGNLLRTYLEVAKNTVKKITN